MRYREYARIQTLPRTLLHYRLPVLLILVVIAQYLGEVSSPWLHLYILCFLTALLFIKKSVVPLIVLPLLCGLLTTIHFPIVSESGLSQPIAVKVDERPRYRKIGEVEVSLKSLTGDERYLCKGVDLPWRNSGKIAYGDTLIFRGDIKPLRFSFNPFSWDRQLARKGYHATCKIRWITKAIDPPSLSIPDRLRDAVVSYVEDKIGNGEKSGLLLSMAFGARDLISIATEKEFQKAGLSHLLVFSGYQLSLVFGLTYTFALSILKCSRKLICEFRINDLASGIALGGMLILLAFSGVEASGVRAAVAASCATVGTCLGRRAGFFRGLLVSVLVLTLLYPGCLFDPSVELSYAALIGIGYGNLSGRSGIKAMICSQAFCSLLTAIVSFFWFGTVSYIGIILNPILAGPLSWLTCIGGPVAIALSALGIDRDGVVLGFVCDVLSFVKDLVTEINNLLAYN